MRLIMRILAGIGLLFILLVAAAIYAVSHVRISGPPPVAVRDNSVLTLAVEGPFAENAPVESGFEAVLSARKLKLRDIIAGIDRGAKDDRIKGLLIKIDASAGMADTQEIRSAIKRFRDAGKFAYAWADDYGMARPGMGEYYLAAAADQVWLQPMGEVMLTGVVFEQPFLKEALAKLDVEPAFAKRAEYKTAPELYTERGFTPAAREMMDSLANDLTAQLVADVGASRGMQSDVVRGFFERGPLTAQEAVEAKLVDHIGYADEAVAAAKKTAGSDSHTLPLDEYSEQTTPRGRPNIALIYEVGTVNRVGGPIDPSNGEHSLGAESTVVRGFEKAIADPAVKAIVFRVDSPGGSVTGSESVRRMVLRAKGAGKKVVVSMGSLAASGGYWISANADKIVADPGTLTGSIGVFTGKFVLGKGLADIGVTSDRTSDGGFAAMNSMFVPFTPEQTQRLNASLDQIYDGFVSRVAEGRKLPPGAVAQSAKGRVWTGQQAKQLGLVDELGGMTDAVKVARDLAGLPADEATVVAVYPKPLTPLETLRAFMRGTDMKSEAGAAIQQMDGPAGTVLRALVPLFDNQQGIMARMPDIGIPK